MQAVLMLAGAVSLLCFQCCTLPVPGQLRLCRTPALHCASMTPARLTLRCGILPAIAAGGIFLPRGPAAAVMHACTTIVLWHWNPRAACLGYGGTLHLPCGLQMKGLVKAALLQQPLEHLQLRRRIGRLPVSLEGQM